MELALGKKVVYKTYFHVEALNLVSVEIQSRIEQAAFACGVERGRDFNVVRVDDSNARVGLLNYPTFFDSAFPALQDAWVIDLNSHVVRHRTYSESRNRPILHRKELLLPDAHPRRAEYVALTQAAESIGLFEDTTRIGFHQQWEQLVRDKGYQVVGHQLVPIGNDESTDSEPESETASIARHLTALVRYGFSAPIQSLARYGLLDGRYTLFDYGCGRGDDMRGLATNGIDVAGWDPHFAPTNPQINADIVNLGFVVNVIENYEERLEAVRRAYKLANQMLVVSVMLENHNALMGQRFNDGILTRRGTFQKYFTQSELKTFLQTTLDEEPIAVAPGIFYVFRNKDSEQRFLTERFRSRRRILRVTSPRPSTPRLKRERRDRALETYTAYRESLDRLWDLRLRLGREPDKSEVQDLPNLLEGFGTVSKALRFIAARNDPDSLGKARQDRIADLLVYFALTLFERRKPYKHLEIGLQRDIKAFFGDYFSAQSAARELLFQIASPEHVNAACREADEHGLGWLVESESLQLHTSMVDQLPPLLRVYVGCASVLYGDYRETDIVKIHIRSSKLSLLHFDDFEGQPVPRMMERVKIKLREQDFDYFKYGEGFEPPLLYNKSRFINEEFPNYPEQVSFEKKLSDLQLFDLSGYGPKPAAFFTVLAANRYEIDGFNLIRSTSIPALDDPCGKYFTYRNFVECGETQAATGLPNLPKEPNSYTAIFDLAKNLIDPIVDFFGMVKLTYGFCSHELAKQIPGRIAPQLDQHAAHEIRKNGELICSRKGAAVDFLVEDEDMFEVAEWIANNLPFDRMYVYGRQLPLHLSHGPENNRQVVLMVRSTNGRLTPKTVKGDVGSFKLPV